jgi:hypothetical protein
MLTDLLGNQVQVAFDAVLSSIEHIRAGTTSHGCGIYGALGGVTGRPERRRCCAGLRGQRLEWNWRPQEYVH